MSDNRKEARFVGHDEKNDGTHRAVFSRPGITPLTKEEERNFRLSRAGALMRVAWFQTAYLDCDELERAVDTWPRPLSRCDHLLPLREPSLVGFGEPTPECLLERRHEGEHLIKTADGRFVLWERDTKFCGDEDHCECLADSSVTIDCFSSVEISDEEAFELLEASDKKRPADP